MAEWTRQLERELAEQRMSDTPNMIIGPIKQEFMVRAMQALKACESQDDFKDAVGKLFREALDAIGYLEQRHDEVISEMRIMTTAMQNLLGVEEGEREEVEQEDGVVMILTESEAKARFVDTCLAVMKGSREKAENDGDQNKQELNL